MADERTRLILEIQGQEEVKRLNVELEKEREYLLQLLAIQKQGIVGVNPQQIEQSADKVIQFTNAINALGGTSGGAQRQGLMGASYAAQDFISVLSGGGGLGRALNSVSNNVDTVARGLGMGIGLAGSISILTALAGAGISILEKWWSTVDSESGDKAQEKLKKIREEIQKTHEAFLKLRGMPTEGETAAAKGITEFLGVRPRAEGAKRAIAEATTAEQAQAAMTSEEREQYRMAAPEAGMSDEAIERMVKAQELAGLSPAELDAHRKQLQDQRREARGRQIILMQQARQRRAEQVLQQAQVAGPEGEQARGALFGVTVGKPGFVGIEELTPDAIEARTERRRLTELQNKQAERMATAEAEADKKRRDEANRQAEQMNRQAQANESARRDKEARDKEKAARDATRAQEKADRELEREAMGARVSEKDIRHERATGTAEQLMAQGPQIVGAAFGPQAAARASAAGPADVQAMKQQTIRNLEAGELPYDAILKAFMEVTQAADRQAQAAQRFTGQMNGMVGRLQSSPWPTGLPR